MSSHSILAPSDSARWLRCVGAVHLSRGLPDVDAEYNASGSCSHWLGQWALEHPDLDLNSWLGKEMTFGENPSFKFTIDAERLDRVRRYVSGVHQHPGQVLIEHRLDTTPVLGVPNQEGHSDAIKLDLLSAVQINGVPHKGVLSVHDYKDGYLLVRAKDNTQGLIYLCAAMLEFSLVGEFNAFRFVIHQPRINHYDEWTYTRAELEAFMTLIRPIAEIAYGIYHGTIAFEPAKHLTAGDEQCQWCPVRGRCIARAQRIISLFEPLINRHELDDHTLSLMFARLDEIEGAARDFRAEALRRALAGHTIEGQKLVRGKRGNRQYKDKAAAKDWLVKLLGPQAFEEPALRTPTDAEKLLKIAHPELAPLLKTETEGSIVMQAEGGYSLAPLDDPRKEIQVETFKPVEEPLI